MKNPRTAYILAHVKAELLTEKSVAFVEAIFCLTPPQVVQDTYGCARRDKCVVSIVFRTAQT